MPSEQEPVPVEAVTETTPHKAGFPSLSFFTTTTDTPPSVIRKEGRFEPCFLFRGQENWLSKFQDEQTEEIKQEVKALVARWLKIQNVSVLLGAGSSLYATGFVGEGLFKKVGSLLNKRQSHKTLEILLKCCSDPKGIGAKFESFLITRHIPVRRCSEMEIVSLWSCGPNGMEGSGLTAVVAGWHRPSYTSVPRSGHGTLHMGVLYVPSNWRISQAHFRRWTTSDRGTHRSH